MTSFIFTSESVSEGHPDKVADQISDAVVDACIKQDPNSRVACETLVKNHRVILAGEITSRAKVDYQGVVREVIRDIGYTDPNIGFDPQCCEILTFISEQSPDISQGVDEDKRNQKEQGAGDQGLMFGFACQETEELMPFPISVAHHLMLELTRVRKSGKVKFLRPDAKCQVSVCYENNKPVFVDTIVLSTQHTEDASLKLIEEVVKEEVVKSTIPPEYLSKRTKFFINPTGRFVIGGPVGDCGLTGRKIIVDTYGGYSRHGGGAFSGKDPSKVDRSAAYATRHIAKNIVGAGIAERCEVQVAYAIGIAKPVAIYVNTFGTGKVPDEKIAAVAQEVFNLTPRGIIEYLQLLRPIYQTTANYGHFGRESLPSGEFSWERLDKVAALKAGI